MEDVKLTEILKENGWPVVKEDEMDKIISQSIELNKTCQDMGPWTGALYKKKLGKDTT